MTLNSKHLAFTLAGGFFVLVSMAFAVVVALGWSASMETETYNAPDRTYDTYEPALPAVVPVTAVTEGYGGRMVAFSDGEVTVLPSLKSDYDVDVRGDLVAVHLTQRFENPGTVALNAEYQFPLPEDAAVYAMTMRVGDEVVRGVMKTREEAVHTYEVAQAAGNAAALTEQVRPNLFTQSVANLMPGMPVEIELRYVHAAKRRDGKYEVVLPLVVGPRYTPPDATNIGAEQDVPVQPPTTIDSDRVSIAFRLDAGMPITEFASDTHELDVERLGEGDARAKLAVGRVVDNRDFVLRYALAGATTKAGLLANYDPEEGRGYFSLLIEPPASAEDIATPREMVFVLDCSGSMAGQPMDASKAFMRHALRGLRPTDTFRIIRFSDGANEYSSTPILATRENVNDAFDYVEGLSGSGGTRMDSGIEQALSVPVPPGSVRLVTFMTDGYIGNDSEVIRLLRAKIGTSRLFAIGVGTSVNRYLIEEMGRMGRGFSRYVDPTEDVDVVASEIAGRLQTPVLTDITLASSDAGFALVSPSQIPDLFSARSVRVSGTYSAPGRHRLVVRGRVAGQAVELPIDVELPAVKTDGDAVRMIWARSQIEDAMHAMLTPAHLRESTHDDADLQSRVTQLGLDHSLMTQWTSFVAVSDAVVNAQPALAQDVPVATSPVSGMSVTAPSYGKFSGGTTPEPGIIGGAILALFAAGSARRRRRGEA